MSSKKMTHRIQAHLCRIIKFSKEIVKGLDKLLGGEGGGQGGEVLDVREEDGHVVVLLYVQLPANTMMHSKKLLSK
jgi:hypothetical protein